MERFVILAFLMPRIENMISTKTKVKIAAVTLLAPLLAVGTFFPALSVRAYGGGHANRKLTISQTGVLPGTQLDFGIWGWCDLSGSSSPSNPTSGTSGDCQDTIYSHAPKSQGGDLSYTLSVTVTSWGEVALGSSGLGQFFGITNDLVALTGTQTITPNSSPLLCGPSGPILPIDLAPAPSGHYNGNFVEGLFGQTGDLQIQVTQTSK
jgi:hypothetical protein